MKTNKKWAGLIVLLAIILCIQFVPVLADEVEDGGEQPEVVEQVDTPEEPAPAPQKEEKVGPIILQQVNITYSKPEGGSVVGNINKTFASDNTILLFNKITWKNADGQELGDSDTFKAGKKYTLLLDLSITGGYLNENTVVYVNGEQAQYDNELTKSVNLQGAGADGYFAASLFTLGVKTDDVPAPGAVFTANSINSGVLTGCDDTMQFSTDGGASWVKCGGASVELKDIAEGEILVEFIDDPANVEHIAVGRQPVPSGINVVNCSNKNNNDGKIAGVNTGMEYRVEGSNEYKQCGGGEITNLVPNKYYVRNIASGSNLSSGDTAVTIAKFSNSVPKITKNPTSSTIASGQDCKFIVKADNAKKYEWHVIDITDKKDYAIDPKEDAKYFKGIGTDTLTVLSVNKLGGGEYDCKYNGEQYYCVVINDAGQVKSKVAKYSVTHYPAKKDEWKFDTSGHWQVCFCGAIINKGEHVDKDSDGACDVCKMDMSNTKEFHILEGAHSTWDGGTAEPLVIKADGDIKEFKELDIDDKTVDESSYDLTEGSTVVSLHPEFLDTLDAGEHTVAFVYANGSVTTQLEVLDRNEKVAGEEAHEVGHKSNIVIILLGAIIVALAVIAIILGKRLKNERGYHEEH